MMLWLRLLFFLALSAVSAGARDLLDGRSFVGTIGPAGKRDLQDTLNFDKGHFWSDICTGCGFEPGVYTAEQTSDGIRFKGVLRSDSRGSFTYHGLVDADGSITVEIAWERRRWYWTTRRQVAFVGREMNETSHVDLETIRHNMRALSPDTNPLCARF